MIAVSSITKNTGRYAMIHTAFFYIPVNFAFNLPHYVTSLRGHDCKYGESLARLKKIKNSDNLSE